MKPGFYWIRRFHDGRLEPAELCADGFWYTIGDSAALRSEKISEIFSAAAPALTPHD